MSNNGLPLKAAGSEGYPLKMTPFNIPLYTTFY